MKDNQFNIQVPAGHYRHTYDDLSRFVSYFYQIDLALKNNPKKILEVGIGNKTVYNYLKNQGIDIIGCDFDARLHPDKRADIRDLPFKKSEFDIALAFEILEHIPFSDVPKALQELQRVSRKQVIISIPYSCMHAECVVKIWVPFCKRQFHLAIRIPNIYKKIRLSGKNTLHYWEMGTLGYSRRKIRKLLKKFFTIEKEIIPLLNSYHYYFILKPRKR